MTGLTKTTGEVWDLIACQVPVWVMRSSRNLVSRTTTREDQIGSTREEDLLEMSNKSQVIYHKFVFFIEILQKWLLMSDKLQGSVLFNLPVICKFYQ